MKNVLKYLIEQSLVCLYANDKDLLERKVAERDITHRFAHYFENNIAGTIVAEYNVDCEYNRDGYGIKQVNGKTSIYLNVLTLRHRFPMSYMQYRTSCCNIF